MATATILTSPAWPPVMLRIGRSSAGDRQRAERGIESSSVPLARARVGRVSDRARGCRAGAVWAQGCPSRDRV